jgi:hypothetical protein
MAEGPEATEISRYREDETVPRKRETVLDANKELVAALDSLEASVTNLFDALEPVTRLDDEPGAMLRSMDTEATSSVQQAIRKATDRVNVLTVRVDARRYRVDI